MGSNADPQETVPSSHETNLGGKRRPHGKDAPGSGMLVLEDDPDSPTIPLGISGRKRAAGLEEDPNPGTGW